MASSVATIKPSANLKVLQFDFDPDGSAAVDVSWQDMRDFGWVMMLVFHSVGTGAVDTFAILANPQADGSGTDVNVKTHAFGNGNPDAVGDTVYLEATASEIKTLGDSLRYVSASVEVAVSTDEAVVTYIFGAPRFAQQSLTTEVIA